MIEMELIGVQLEMPSNSPVLLLRESNSQGRVLPVVIDLPEAQAIGRGMDGVRTARPMTHDLMKNLLDTLGAKVVKVTVTELVDRTFYAVIELQTAGGESLEVSSRPSDAVALAVRTQSPIFASEEVMDEAGQFLEGLSRTEDSGEVDEEVVEELVDEFKAFLDDISPEDFQN
ncbi:MAG TPA: bifunctional nuclease family protein [Acidimicrobiales bacterium]|nr:bifunctional nuclease family protein [Acidimicrobiales bacterium]